MTKKVKTKIIVCSFSVGIDDLSRKQQRDAYSVLKILAETKRFSIFEATANNTIAATMDRLEDVYYVRTGGAYPWIEIALTRAGRDLLNEHKVEHAQ